MEMVQDPLGAGVFPRVVGSQRRRRVLAATPVARVVALLAACGQASGGAPAPATNPAVTLEFWHNKGQPEGQDVTAIVGKYNGQATPTQVKELYQGDSAT